MFKSSSAHPRRMFFIGAGLGTLVGGGVLLGVLLTVSISPWPSVETSLEAVASSGSDTMAIATGPIDEGVGVEGLFVLDFITSELTCQVMNPRTGKLGGVYRRRVSDDLGVEQGKQPKYLLLTGNLQVRQNVGNIKPADSIVYVADAATGKYVAYMLPWNKAAFNFNQNQVADMIPIGGGSARNVDIEK